MTINTRTTDPETSFAAARSVKGLAETYRIILDILRANGPMNDVEIIERFRSLGIKAASDSGIRSRRSELTASGLITDSGSRKEMESGRMSIVWSLA